MTQAQHRTTLTLLHRILERVENIEERLSFVYPTEAEAVEQMAREVDAILGAAVKAAT